MTVKRARSYDALALLTVILIVVLDQWTKALVVANLSTQRETNGPPVPLIGQYLVLQYIQNRGAAFGLLSNSVLLVVFIVIAIGVVSYLYMRILNSGPLAYKLVFGMIIGGALGNLLDRAQHSGYVVDFIYFRIPQIGFYFAIFNLADASISVGVFLLFVLVLFSGMGKSEKARKEQNSEQSSTISSTSNSGALRTSEQDAQS